MRSISAPSNWLTAGSGVQFLNSTICFMESDDLERDFVCGRRECAIELSQILNGKMHVERRSILFNMSDLACLGDGDHVPVAQHPRQSNLWRGRVSTQRNAARSEERR